MRREFSNSMRDFLIIKIIRYLFERIRWNLAGCPTRSPDQIKDIFLTHCSQCENFDGDDTEGICGICGCLLKKSGKDFNKLYWATTRCPDNPPKWM